MTSNRKEHQEQVHESQRSPLKPTAGKKGGELPTAGHGPSTRENRETSKGGGKEKDRKKPD